VTLDRPTRIVLDASAAVDLALGRPWSALLRHEISGADRLHVPVTWHIECVSAVSQLTLGERLDDPGARRALNALASLRLLRWATEPLNDRVWSLRHNMTAYDAVYVALAEQLEATLATGDRRLANAARLATSLEVLELTP